MITATKRFHFCYAHWLENYEGKCKYLHGHNAILEVTVAGKDSKYPAMVMDFNKMKKIVDVIIEKLDHMTILHAGFFSMETSLFADNRTNVLRTPETEPTAENIAKYIWTSLDKEFTDLVRIRLYETPDCWVEIERDK